MTAAASLAAMQQDSSWHYRVRRLAVSASSAAIGFEFRPLNSAIEITLL